MDDEIPDDPVCESQPSQKAKTLLEWITVVGAAGKILMVAILAVVLLWNWGAIKAVAKKYSVTNVQAFGVEFEVIADAEKKVVAANSTNQAVVQIAFRRIERVASLFRNKRFMWLDDTFSNNAVIINYFESLGVDVRTEPEADQSKQNSFYSRLNGFKPHLLLMDTTRPGDSNEVVIAKLRREFGFPGRIVIYSSTQRPLPDGAQAYVTNLWELLHVVCDQVERIDSEESEGDGIIPSPAK